MKPHYQNNGVQIFAGDVRAILPCLESESVQCVVTSPPYWGLRDYGCEGQLGLERTPELYVSEMVAVFREVRRVLKDDGTLWLNMGDSYGRAPEKGGSGPNGKHDFIPDYGNARRIMSESKGSSDGKVGRGDRAPVRNGAGGLKPKDLVGIPWMLAFALRADGWYLRSDIIWHKPNPMPESVTDRPTKSHEYLFLLSKSERYYYDCEAIKEASITGDPRKPYAPGQVDSRGNGHDRGGGTVRQRKPAGWDTGSGAHGSVHRDGRAPIVEYSDVDANSRNKRSVWTVATQAFPEAHFATFPEDLIRPCILAGCPAGGTVLDPFGGSGTTALVATQNHCKAILVELNLDYIAIAAKRLSQEVLQF